MAEMQDGTLSHSLEELKRTIDTSILKPIGEFLLPLVTSVVKFVTTKIIPIIGAVVKAILTIGNAVKTIVVKIADGIGEMAEIGKNIVEGL